MKASRIPRSSDHEAANPQAVPIKTGLLDTRLTDDPLLTQSQPDPRSDLAEVGIAFGCPFNREPIDLATCRPALFKGPSFLFRLSTIGSGETLEGRSSESAPTHADVELRWLSPEGEQVERGPLVNYNGVELRDDSLNSVSQGAKLLELSSIFRIDHG